MPELDRTGEGRQDAGLTVERVAGAAVAFVVCASLLTACSTTTSPTPGGLMPPAAATRPGSTPANSATAPTVNANPAKPASDASAAIAATISHLDSLDISRYLGRKVKRGSAATKMVALTFDDGPSKNTLAVLDVLRTNGAKATFFFVGGRAQDNPQLPAAVLAQGSEIGNHTYLHVRLLKMSQATFDAEVGRTQRVIEALTGYTPKIVRPQGGRQDAAGIAEAARAGLVLVDWSIHSTDTDKKATVASITRAATGARGGDIILMHETRKESVKSVAGIIRALKARGLRFVTVSELLAASK